MKDNNKKSDFEIYIEKMYPNFMYILSIDEIIELKKLYDIYVHWEKAIDEAREKKLLNSLKIYESYMNNATFIINREIEKLKEKHKNRQFTGKIKD